MRRVVYAVPLIVIIALSVLMAKRLADVGAGDAPNLLDTALLDRPLPDFDLDALPDRPPGLASTDLKGEVALVNIWGSWCIACLAEHPTFMRLAERDAVPIHGIAWRDEPNASIRWLARHGDPYQRIGQDRTSDTAIALGVTGAPETFVVDAEGIIRYKYVGPITDEVWAEKIKPVVESLRQ